MEDKYQKGSADSKPYYVVDEESGKLMPIYFPADAVMPKARPGVKAGNPLLDEINEELRKENIIEKMKRLYKINSLA
ncbi:MAG: hypothetical protein KKF74_02135, partial [Nanoarchaeota archaeon]|nr:hypothetical protein [Nanoarchaeota archaeon]